MWDGEFPVKLSHTFRIDQAKVANSCLHQELAFLFLCLVTVFKAFSCAFIYCHTVPSLTTDLPIAKFHGQFPDLGLPEAFEDAFSVVHSET